MIAGILALVQLVIGVVEMSAAADVRFATRVVAAVERLAPDLGEQNDDAEPLRRYLATLEPEALRRWVYELLREVMAYTPALRESWDRAASDVLGHEPGTAEHARLLSAVESRDVDVWSALAACSSAVAEGPGRGRGAHELALWTLEQAEGDRRLLVAQVIVALTLAGGDIERLAGFLRGAFS